MTRAAPAAGSGFIQKLRTPPRLGKTSVQAERDPGVAQPARGDQRRPRHFHRMQLALDVAGPEVEETTQHRKLRRDVQMLPNEALQQTGMVRQMIEDLCRCPPVPSQP